MRPAREGSPLASRTRAQRAGHKRGGPWCWRELPAGGAEGWGHQTETAAIARPRTADTSAAAARGLEEAAPRSVCAELRAIFSSSAEDLQCERQPVAGGGQGGSASPAGSGSRAVPVRCGMKTAAPAGRAAPLLALPGAPLPGRGKCHWCYWCCWCPAGSSWPGDALPGFPRPDQALAASFIWGKRGRSRWRAGCESVSPGARARRSSIAPSPPQRNPSPGAPLASPPRRSPPSIPSAPRRGRDTRGPPPPSCAPRVCLFLWVFLKRKAKRGGKMVFRGRGRQGPRGSWAPPSRPRPPGPGAAPAGRSGLVPAGRRRVSLPNRAQPGSSSCRHVPAPARSPVVLFN